MSWKVKTWVKSLIESKIYSLFLLIFLFKKMLSIESIQQLKTVCFKIFEKQSLISTLFLRNLKQPNPVKLLDHFLGISSFLWPLVAFTLSPWYLHTIFSNSQILYPQIFLFYRFITLLHFLIRLSYFIILFHNIIP